MNLQEVLDSLDIFRKVTGLRLEDIYNTMLAKGWTLGSGLGVQFMHGVIRLYHGATVRLLTQHWVDTQPDLVVSLVPNFNRAMYESLRKALPQVAVRYDPDRFRGLPAAFLDGSAARSVLRLWDGEGSGAGAFAGAYGRPDFHYVGDDCAAAFL